jgi:hypothetical protein
VWSWYLLSWSRNLREPMAQNCIRITVPCTIRIQCTPAPNFLNTGVRKFPKIEGLPQNYMRNGDMAPGVFAPLLKYMFYFSTYYSRFDSVVAEPEGLLLSVPQFCLVTLFWAISGHQPSILLLSYYYHSGHLSVNFRIVFEFLTFHCLGTCRTCRT